MRNFFILAIILISGYTQAQNVTYAQEVIDTLCSPYFGGRGYVNHGVKRAGDYIANAYRTKGLDPFIDGSYYHRFKLNVNTFPDKVEIKQDDQTLNTGADYIVSADCPSFKGSGTAVLITAEKLLDGKSFKTLRNAKTWKSGYAVIDTLPNDKKIQKRLKAILKKYPHRITFHVAKKLTWSVARNQGASASVSVLPGVIQDGKKLSINIEAEFKTAFSCANIVGSIKGSEVPDSFIFVTGHYDHLGHMGKDTYIAGANDNASGIAMILDLVDYYTKNPPRYTMVFIGFAGEEAGLVGSYFFVNEMVKYVTPSRIRFVLNMDLMGSGQEGIMVVNGAVFTEEYEEMVAINDTHNYMPQVKKRGKAANSDHYFFSEAGIPAYFYYLMGPYSHYHDIDDKAENLRLEKKAYDGAFMLIRDFANHLMGQVSKDN